MRATFRFIVPLLILGAALYGAWYLMSHPPETGRQRKADENLITVDAKTLKTQAYAVIVESFGFVEPRTQSDLVAQVGGQIVEVSPNFRDGGFFDDGERLFLIDPRDYAIKLKIAQAELVSSQQALVEEQARVAQALKDWDRLGDGNEAPPLVIREPQLRAAEAATASAEARVAQARLDLERTAVIAPFAGRIRSRAADLGQVVVAGERVASIYATDAVEVALPIKNRDLSFIDLPEAADDGSARQDAVRLRSDLSPGVIWNARLVRTEGAIDEASRQLRVVARIDDPFSVPGAIKIGQYLKAEIDGRTLEDVLVIPNEAIYQGSYVYVVTDGVLQRREIAMAWRNATEAVVASGLDAGEALVLTPLGQVNSGTRVRVREPAPVAPDGGDSR